MNKNGRMRKLLVSALIPLMFFLALASWGLSSAVGSSPDDEYHLASIWCGQGLREGICEAGASDETRVVPRVINERSSCYAYRPNQSAACEVPVVGETADTNRGNFAGGYPPVFYATMSVFVSADVSASVILMRTANAFLFVGLASLLFFLLPRSRRDALVLGAMVSLVPLGMFLIPSTNPSSWAVISAVTLWVSLLGFFETTSAKRKIALGSLATLATLLGAGARGDAAVYGIVAMLAAMVLSFQKTRRYALSCLLPLGLAIGSALLFLSAGQAAVLTPDAFDAGMTQDQMLSLLVADLQLLPELWVGALGTWGLGWLDTPLPGIVWVTCVAIFSAMIFGGLTTSPPRKSIAFAGVFVSLIIIPMYILVNDRVIVGAFVQPRYIYPLMIMLAGVALLQLDRSLLRFSWMQLMSMASALSIANAVALHINIRRYITGLDVGGFNLSNSPEWWWNLPIGPMGVWVIGAFSFAVALFGFAIYLRASERTDDTRDLARNLSVSRPLVSG